MNIFKKNLIFFYLTVFSLFLLLNGCKTTVNDKGVEGGTTNLQELENLNWSPKRLENKEINGVRTQALRDTALSVGARSGLAYRAKEINASTYKNTKKLDRIFNFRALLIDGNILPPVLEEAKSTLNVASNDALRLSDKIYRILQQAQFVSAPPHWRDYLILNFEKPDIPDRTLLPRDTDEKAVWKEYADIGFQDGIIQANTIYAENVARLRRDYQGMLIYRKLLAQHMVSKPMVAKANLGVTGNKSEIRINDQILRITSPSALDPNSKHWKAVTTSNS